MKTTHVYDVVVKTLEEAGIVPPLRWTDEMVVAVGFKSLSPKHSPLAYVGAIVDYVYDYSPSERIVRVANLNKPLRQALGAPQDISYYHKASELLRKDLEKVYEFYILPKSCQIPATPAGARVYKLTVNKGRGLNPKLFMDYLKRNGVLQNVLAPLMEHCPKSLRLLNVTFEITTLFAAVEIEYRWKSKLNGLQPAEHLKFIVRNPNLSAAK